MHLWWKGRLSFKENFSLVYWIRGNIQLRLNNGLRLKGVQKESLLLASQKSLTRHLQNFGHLIKRIHHIWRYSKLCHPTLKCRSGANLTNRPMFRRSIRHCWLYGKETNFLHQFVHHVNILNKIVKMKIVSKTFGDICRTLSLRSRPSNNEERL